MKPLASTVDCCMILLVLQAAFRLIAAVDVPSVLCKEPVLTTVAVDEPAHRFYPYYIQLHQCQGSWNHESPNIKHCVATGYKEIKLTVYSTLHNWERTQITMHNHTSCGPECKATANDCDFRVQRWNDQTCKCECLYKASPPPNDVIKRKEGFRWNKHLCRYECGRPHAFCPVKKIWSREKCGCVCRSFHKLNCEDDNKHMDSETCECKDPRHLMNGKRPGFLTYFESQILVASLVATVLVIVGLSTRLIYLGRQLTPQTAKSEGSDMSDFGSDFPSQATFESAV